MRASGRAAAWGLASVLAISLRPKKRRWALAVRRIIWPILADATIGEGSNIGAGSITCNYDGANKHHTQLGDGVFIGSNSTLVAPVTIADGGFIAAGSVITKDVGGCRVSGGQGKAAQYCRLASAEEGRRITHVWHSRSDGEARSR